MDLIHGSDPSIRSMDLIHASDPSTAPYDNCGTSRQDEALRLSALRFGKMEEDAPSKAMLDKEREERIR